MNTKSLETKLAAVDMLNKGTSANKVAKIYGVTAKSICNWRDKYSKTKTAAPKTQAVKTEADLILAMDKTTGHWHSPKDLGRIYSAIETLKLAGLLN